MDGDEWFDGWVEEANTAAGPQFDSPYAIEQEEQLNQARAYLEQAMRAASETEVQPGHPSYAHIYSFLGSLFDTSPPAHIDTLAKLSAIDREIIQLLMQNLMLNLSTQEFRDQYTPLIEQYNSLLKTGPVQHEQPHPDIPDLDHMSYLNLPTAPLDHNSPSLGHNPWE